MRMRMSMSMRMSMRMKELLSPTKEQPALHTGCHLEIPRRHRFSAKPA